MKELVQANMLEFIDELGCFLADLQFTYHDERGTSHPHKYLRNLPKLHVSPEGIMYTTANMGGIATTISTHTLQDGGNLITNREDTCRTWFTFTDNTPADKILRVRTHFAHPSMQGYSTVRRFVVGS